MSAKIELFPNRRGASFGDSIDLSEYIQPSFFRRTMRRMTGTCQIAIVPGAEEAIAQTIKASVRTSTVKNPTVIGGVIRASIAGRVIFTGFVERRRYNRRADSETLTFLGRGLLADIIDSNPPYKYNDKFSQDERRQFRTVINKLLVANGDQGIQTTGGDNIKMAVAEFVVDPERSIERNIRAAAKGIIGVHIFESADGMKLTLWDKTLATKTEQEIKSEDVTEISINTDTSDVFHSYLQAYDFANETTEPVIVTPPANSLYLPETIREERKWVREYTGKDRDGLSAQDAGLQTEFVRHDSIREGLRRLADAETVDVTLPGLFGVYEIGQIISIQPPGLTKKIMMISETEHRIADKAPGHETKLTLSHIPAWEGL